LALSTNDFEVLDALDSGEITTQRQLAEHTGISLGQINYVLKRLLEKGLVKIGNFKKNPHKIGYAYLLTPKGIEEKSRLAVRFVVRKLDEYSRLQDRIAQRLSAIDDKKGRKKKRVVFVGPEMVCDFVEEVVRSRRFNLAVVQCCQGADELAATDAGKYDVVLLSDEHAGSPQKIAADTGLPREIFLPLW
jgi:EPS-associated MarR family transcriptional regulator